MVIISIYPPKTLFFTHATSFQAGPSCTYDKLRQSADKDWTLAGDDQVLRLMQRIGRNLETRTISVTHQIDKMLVNVDRTRVQLENVNNKLVALQKTHFFDHRIQEDDEEFLLRPSEEQPSSDAPTKLTKAAAEEVLKRVLRDTVDAVDKCYEKIVLDWSDSILDQDDDDEDVMGRTMIRPIDAYKDLPRPHLIGSDKWRRSQFVGLKPEEEEEKRPVVQQNNNSSVQQVVPIEPPQIPIKGALVF